MIDVAVAPLERQPSVDGLDVIDHGLGLDADSPRRATDDGIPGSKITRNGKRHFRRPAQSWSQPAPKSFQQSRLPCVPNWVAGWMRSEANIEGDRATDAGELLDRDPTVRAGLKAAHGGP